MIAPLEWHGSLDRARFIACTAHMVETAPANVSIVVLGPETFATHAPNGYLGGLVCIAHVEAPENLAHYFLTHRGDYLPVAASHLPAPQPKDTE